MGKKRKKISYGSDVFDMSMVLDEPSLLNKKGKKKRIQWKRRGLAKVFLKRDRR